MIPTCLLPLANHLWQSTIFAVTVALLCFALRKRHASLRCWLWLAASAKFLIPLSWLIDLGSRFETSAAPAPDPTTVSSAVRNLSQPFALPAPAPFLESVPNGPSPIPAILLAIWLSGFAVSALLWLRAWLRMRSAARSGSPREIPGFHRIRIVRSSLPVEPCVFGVFQPVLLLPDGIDAHVTRQQLETILLHEVCHVRRHDNLTAALHLLAETVFWFYPPIHWIGRRLMAEREAACDEEVLRALPAPEPYAQGILAVCRFALQSSPAPAAGIAGPDLKRRIERIMERRAILRLDPLRKSLLAVALAAAIGGPFWTGLVFVRASRAQSPSGNVTPFAVASIKPNRSGGLNSGFRRAAPGQLNALNATLKMLIAFAYDLPGDRILQGPAWLDAEHYDILAKPDSEGGRAVDTSVGALRLRTQALLADRFKLVLHKDTRQLPIFKLLVDKGGPKNLHPAAGNQPDLVNNGHHVSCQSASMAFFAKILLTDQLGGPVLDYTGIQGNFDFSMDWAPDDTSPRHPPAPGEPTTLPDSAGPSFLTALREQLGLRVEAAKGPVEVLIVDHAEKASEN